MRNFKEAYINAPENELFVSAMGKFPKPLNLKTAVSGLEYVQGMFLLQSEKHKNYVKIMAFGDVAKQLYEATKTQSKMELICTYKRSSRKGEFINEEGSFIIKEFKKIETDDSIIWD